LLALVSSPAFSMSASSFAAAAFSSVLAMLARRPLRSSMLLCRYCCSLVLVPSLTLRRVYRVSIVVVGVVMVLILVGVGVGVKVVSAALCAMFFT
jgi:hypothetical protein